MLIKPLGIFDYRDIKDHCPEDFWYIHVVYVGSEVEEKKADGPTCEFKWRRGRLFDQFVAVAFFSLCKEEPLATVTKVYHSPS